MLRQIRFSEQSISMIQPQASFSKGQFVRTQTKQYGLDRENGKIPKTGSVKLQIVCKIYIYRKECTACLLYSHYSLKDQETTGFSDNVVAYISRIKSEFDLCHKGAGEKLAVLVKRRFSEAITRQWNRIEKKRYGNGSLT